MAQFRELLSTGLFTVIVLFSVVACSSNDDVDEFTDTSYTFDGIEWAIIIVHNLILHTPRRYHRTLCSYIMLPSLSKRLLPLIALT